MGHSANLLLSFAPGRDTGLCSQSWVGEDGAEFSPFASVLGQVEAERCQAGHVSLPTLILSRQYPIHALSGILAETSQKTQRRRALPQFVL